MIYAIEDIVCYTGCFIHTQDIENYIINNIDLILSAQCDPMYTAMAAHALIETTSIFAAISTQLAQSALARLYSIGKIQLSSTLDKFGYPYFIKEIPTLRAIKTDKTIQVKYGVNCNRCNEYYEYAEYRQGFVCYGCRH